MKKFVPLALMVLASMACAIAQEASNPSLGDVVRKQHAQTQAGSRKVWTNEDFSSQEPAAQPAENAANAEPNPSDASANAEPAADKPKEASAKSTVDEQAKLDGEWKAKLDTQKARIADLKREYDLTERENKLTATTYYADAGNRLRDQKDFLDKQTASHDKMTTLQKQIADEQAKLSDMQDQAHKAGANKAYE